MVEMLAVLVIIGILSLVGVTLYEYARNSFQTSQIQKSVLAAKTMSEVNNQPTHVKEINRYIEKTLSQYKLDTEMVEFVDDIDKFTITLHEVPKQIQNLV